MRGRWNHQRCWRMISGKAMLRRTVMCGYSAYDWNTKAMSRLVGGSWSTRRSSMWISPLVTLSRPASMRSSVDLPQPEGPSSTRNSPSATSSEMSLTTRSVGEGLGDVLELDGCHGTCRLVAAQPLTLPAVMPDTT